MTEAIITASVEKPIEPRELLQALEMIERQGMPPGTRCYLVAINHEGTRTMTAVPSGSSVLDIEKDLIDHLGGWVLAKDDFLIKLRDYLTERLKYRKVELRHPDEVKRERIIQESAWELEEIGQTLIKKARTSNEESLLSRCLALRVVELASITMGAVDADDADELAQRLFGRPEEVAA